MRVERGRRVGAFILAVLGWLMLGVMLVLKLDSLGWLFECRLDFFDEAERPIIQGAFRLEDWML